MTAAPPFRRPRFRAVIFDMDGVLTDSEPAFYAAFNDILARYGTHIGLDEYAQFIGTATPHTWNEIIALKGLPLTLEEALEIYEPVLMKRLREPRPALPGARRLVETLRARGVPVGLATASYRRWVDAVLEGAGLTGMFDALSTADLVEQTKPDPAPYVVAAEMLGLAASQCVAVEDSVSGVTSALRAGCHTLQLRATATAAAPVEGVHGVIASLEEFPLALVVDEGEG